MKLFVNALAVFVVGAALSLFPHSHAAAACNGTWDLLADESGRRGSISLEQSNGPVVHLYVQKQSGDTFSGWAAFANYEPIHPFEGSKTTTYRATLSGSLKGNTLDFRLYFRDATGVYKATIDDEGRIVGRTHDEKSPGSTATFQSQELLKCIPIEASTPLLPPADKSKGPPDGFVAGGLVVEQFKTKPGGQDIVDPVQKPATEILQQRAPGAEDAVDPVQKPATEILKEQASLPQAPEQPQPTESAGPAEPSRLPSAPEGAVVAVLKQAANVRAGPDKHARILGKLPAGTPVPIIACKSSWCKAGLVGFLEAWIYQPLLTFPGPVTASNSKTLPSTTAKPSKSPSLPMPPLPPAAAPGFAGNWATVTGEGARFEMILTQADRRVTGSYSPNNGFIEGTVGANGRLTYRWRQDGGYSCAGVFHLAPDGRSFSGTFSNSADPNEISGSWYGTRK